jgi:hypothetical protein
VFAGDSFNSEEFKQVWDIVQVVESLPHKLKAFSSNSRAKIARGREKKRERERQKEREREREDWRKAFKTSCCRALLAHTYNPSYSGGRNQEHHGSKPAWANRSQDPDLKNPITKIGLVE